ncbi:MAG: hypothetical protein VSS75_008745 [Candidatus Parabeggiatoa sp.]|nr:hypothetical protein [Candidatus Parabeggiatoa sp.]
MLRVSAWCHNRRNARHRVSASRLYKFHLMIETRASRLYKSR